MIRRYVGATCMAVVLAACASPAGAQPQGGPVSAASGPGLGTRRVVVSAGGAWTGAESIGDVQASSRQPALGTLTPPAVRVFETTSTLGGAPSANIGVSVGVSNAWSVELRGSLSTPILRTAISADVEGGSGTATERVMELVVDASLRWHPRVRLGRRGRPYALAGAGYLRQLHDDRVLAETGTTAHVGAGLQWWLTGGTGRMRSLGLSPEVRWSWRRDGITFDDKTRGVPSASLRVLVPL